MDHDTIERSRDACRARTGPSGVVMRRAIEFAVWMILGVVFAMMDFFTGPYLQFPFFFLIPIGWATWYGGRKVGVTLAFGLPLIRPVYFMEFWESGFGHSAVVVNAAIKILVFTIFAELIHRIGTASRLRAQILECLPIGMWVANREGRLIQSNPAGRAIWGVGPGVDPSAEAAIKVSRHDTGRELKRGEWSLKRAIHGGEAILDEVLDIRRPDGVRRVIYNSAIPLRNELGGITGALLINQDITEAKRAERERENLILSLEEARRNLKVLGGLLPVCANCKRIRDDHGSWHQMEAYIRSHSEAEFSHGICPDCLQRHYPGFAG